MDASTLHTQGHMAAFFSLHGGATLANLWARKRFGRRLPRGLGILLHWVWMILTGPLFFTPMLEILPLRSITLW